jgi:hypothetical protein
VAWTEAFIIFLICHLAGDFLLQTEWQAINKQGGLGADPIARRALLSHIASYLAAFLPALIWVAIEREATIAVVVAIVIAGPHLVQDDGRLIDAYLRRVKGVRVADETLRMAVDQSCHLLALFGAALLAAA